MSDIQVAMDKDVASVGLRSVVGVMKMGNLTLRVEIERTSLELPGKNNDNSISLCPHDRCTYKLVFISVVL